MNDTKQAPSRHSSEFLPCEIPKKPHSGTVNAIGRHKASIFFTVLTVCSQLVVLKVQRQEAFWIFGWSSSGSSPCTNTPLSLFHNSVHGNVSLSIDHRKTAFVQVPLHRSSPQAPFWLSSGSSIRNTSSSTHPTFTQHLQGAKTRPLFLQGQAAELLFPAYMWMTTER